jgi:glycosyltransferase involved in cell wall biosynthesis
VIAMRGGGALETVVEGETGAFWEGGADELAAAVDGFDDRGVDPNACRENAARFDESVFRATLPREVERAFETAREQQHPDGRTWRRTPRRSFARSWGIAQP